MDRAPLPIDSLLPEIVTALGDSNCLVLRAPPGAGKTTRVPPALLDAKLAADKALLLIEPRRLAARAAAARIAAERGTRVGDEIGYQVRFEKRVGPATRIVAMTDGVLLARLQDDPFLEDVGCVVFDEFHERGLNVDLALAMLRRAQLEIRPDLRIVVMSATLATQSVARFLGDCPVLESAGRSFPIEVRYARFARAGPLEDAVATAITAALAETSGHVLAFLPGRGEIRRTQERLAASDLPHATLVLPMHGELSLEEQQAVLAPTRERKIVLATNVAETSVTIEGVTFVVDSGLARRQQFDSSLGLNHLELGRIARSAADQRAGRAGRTAPGICQRLWTEREHQGLAEFEVPEVQRVELSGPVLSLLAWGEADPAGFAWFESPGAEALSNAMTLLRRLGAIDERGLTSLGRRMAQLPTHPRIARLLLAGEAEGQLESVALAAAMLSERDAMPRLSGRPRAAQHQSTSDVLDRMDALEHFEKHKRAGGDVTMNRDAARFVLRARDQLRRMLSNGRTGLGDPAESGVAVRRALLAAFPDRLARRREPGGRRAVMLGGRGVVLAQESAVLEAELFVAVDLEESGHRESLVRQASAVERDWLPPERCSTSIEVEYDAARRRVVSIRRTRFEDLVIEEGPSGQAPGPEAAEILAREAAVRLDRSAWLGPEVESFLARVDLLRRTQGEAEWPTFDDARLDALLPQLCQGCVSLDDLRGRSLLGALSGSLSSKQLASLERDAPLRLRVPSGSQIALDYTIGKPPVLAVKIQELFGLSETPRIAGGRVRVLLHLLAPNGRAQQITDDLASFWANTYEQVRKDLKRRYPRHAWPDDPRQARAEYAPGRRRN